MNEVQQDHTPPEFAPRNWGDYLRDAQNARRVIVAGPRSTKPELTTGQILSAMQANIVAQPIVAGCDVNGEYAEEDYRLLDKVRHVLRKGERLIELIARVGISPGQLRAMTKQEIATFCAQAMANAEAQGVSAPRAFAAPTGRVLERPPYRAVIVG